MKGMKRGKLKRTILLSNPRPDPPGRFVDHNVSEPVLSPLAEGTGHLLPCSDL